MWCLATENVVSADNFPGCEKVEADFESRVEWRLDPNIFHPISAQLGSSEIDLFASRANVKPEKYVSWNPEQETWAVDAFSLNLSEFKSFSSSHFSLLPRALQKLEWFEGDCVWIAPLWRTQAWFTKMPRILVDHPVILPAYPNLLRHLVTGEQRPLRKKVRLIACLLCQESAVNADSS